MAERRCLFVGDRIRLVMTNDVRPTFVILAPRDPFQAPATYELKEGTKVNSQRRGMDSP